MYCKNCGRQIDDNAFICVHCGVRTDAVIPLNKSEERAFCSHCGQEIDPNAYVCVHCGVKVLLDEPVSKRKGASPTLFAILGFIFTAIMFTFLGALSSVVGIVKANTTGDRKGLRINVAALIFTAFISAVTIILALI